MRDFAAALVDEATGLLLLGFAEKRKLSRRTTTLRLAAALEEGDEDVNRILGTDIGPGVILAEAEISRT